ncbi:hypothetical protein [Nocardia tengchongensis]|uniref:hypothetical protein n=1 Tax=Nocardia tengchongensis TaxID=2055889 RepID=UPI0036C37CAD
MIDQIVPMAGVLLGSAATYIGTALAERAKFQRQLQTRWDQGKLDVYAEYATAVKNMLRAAGRLAEANGKGSGEITVLTAELEAADDRRSTVFERLVLLGDPDVTEAAKSTNQLVLEAKQVARATHAGETPLMPGDAVVAALNTLHEAARHDLGIRRPPRRRPEPGRLPQPGL